MQPQPFLQPPQRNEQWLKDSNSCYTHTGPSNTEPDADYGMWVHTSFSSTSKTQGQHCQNRFIINLALFTSICRTGNSISSDGRLEADPCGLLKGIRWQIWLRREYSYHWHLQPNSPHRALLDPHVLLEKKQCSTTSE